MLNGNHPFVRVTCRYLILASSIVDVQNGWARISHDDQRIEGRLADLEARSQRMEALLATLPESLSSLRKTVDELERRVEMSIDDAHNNITILINAVVKHLQVPEADLIELQQYRERGQVDVDG